MTDANISRDWPAPAKLNLFLHITGRRADGYHTLQTLFQFLDHGDLLDFSVRADGRIVRVAGPADIPPDQDLAVRAARLLQAAAGVSLGADIHLHKRLPAQAGLGGGSSDAATTLVALNLLWGAGLPVGQLAALGLKLGADVPVFVHGRAAWAEGVGEQLTPLNELPEPWFLVIKPAAEVSTHALFQAAELTRNSLPITIAGFRAGLGHNDFEPVVRSRYPAVAAALDWLAEHGRGSRARLTGSGACVFAEFQQQADAQAVQADLPQGWQAFIARGCNRSPLWQRLAAET